MNRIQTPRMRVALSAFIAAALLALGALPALSALDNATAARRLSEIKGNLASVVAGLALKDQLNSNETASFRRDLASIYRSLESLEAELGGSSVSQPPAVEPDIWRRYDNATRSVTPAGATWQGWQASNNLASAFGQNSEIIVTVTNGYTAQITLKDAFRGAVKSSASTGSNGEIVVRVEDERGVSEFKIEQGGLGPISVRGYVPAGGGKTTQPVQGPAGAIPPGSWDRAYRDAVAKGELDRSAVVDWLTEQMRTGGYASDPLRGLGSYLKDLEGRSAPKNIATLKYYTNKSVMTVDMPDPRVSPKTFVNVLGRIFALDSAQEWYDIELAD